MYEIHSLYYENDITMKRETPAELRKRNAKFPRDILTTTSLIRVIIILTSFDVYLPLTTSKMIGQVRVY